jgi:hypothetical protein
MLRRDDVIEALRLRYDHFSALAVLEAALARAGITDQPVLDATALAQLRGALHQVGDRLGAVDARLDELAGGGGGGGKPAEAPAKPAAEPSAKPAPAEPPKSAAPVKPAAEPAKAESAEAAKAAPEAKGKHAPEAKGKHAPEAKGKHGHDAKHAHASAVTLVLTGVEPDAGAHVLACGAGPLLGDWDPAHAVALHRDGKAWTATLDAAPGAELAFKFLVRNPDGTLTWEDGDDRHAHAGDRVEATWRHAPA